MSFSEKLEVLLLSDNISRNPELQSEHGLSLFLRTGGRTILFDAGASDLFLKNAVTLGLDLGDVDLLVLSHSHYDHTGGLGAFVKANSKAPIWVKEGFFQPKHKGERYIGPPELGVPRERFEILSGPREAAPGLRVLTDIPLRNLGDAHMSSFRIYIEGKYLPDTFEDEVFLLWEGGEESTVISACSHRGLGNILLAAQDSTGVFPRHALGGFHLKDDPPRKRRTLAQGWKAMGLERILPCHCTGEDSLDILREVFPHQVRSLSVGSKILLS